MASRQRWIEFFARHSEERPGGVIDQLFTDWQNAKAQADSKPPSRPSTPIPGRNRDNPRRIAQMLAERLRRRQ